MAGLPFMAQSVEQSIRQLYCQKLIFKVFEDEDLAQQPDSKYKPFF